MQESLKWLLNVLIHSPNAIIVVVSNPMDTMTYLALNLLIAKNRIIGMGGAQLCFRTYLSMALGKPANDISAMVMEVMVILQ
jgi:malate dehydrogenase